MLNRLSKKTLLPAGILLCSFMYYPPPHLPVKTAVLKADYPVKPVPFTDVQLTDAFWKPRIDKLLKVTIPHELDELSSTGRVKNFQLAAKKIETGEKAGSFCTQYPFDDSDLFKVIEGISYLLQTHPDKALKARMDSLINLVAAAQEPDGYLYTARTIDPLHPPEWSGLHRWENEEKLSHELYNAGHLYQAASANYTATGDRKLLNVALKNAALIDKTFGWGKLQKYPGHPEIELGLVSLYRVTGDTKYLDLAKFFLDVRGPGGNSYEQAQQKVIDQHEAVGHAVRGGYLYSAMTDVSALTGEKPYLHAADDIWKDIVSSKIYITGGIGSTSNGEAFGEPYQLPNRSAYCETCASIANVFFNERLFLSHGNSEYYDVLERTLYNGLLSGLSLKGDRFFYSNPLESAGQYGRSAWFGCSCCPTNLARFLPTVGGYIYALQGNTLYVNLYAANNATIKLPDQTVHIAQQTDYPWSGKVILKVNPEKMGSFTLKLRIPGWALNKPIPSDLYTFTKPLPVNYSVKVNQQEIHLPRLENGYVVIRRTWKAGDEVTLDLPMEVRSLEANSGVKDDRDKMALQRGPLVYCLEGPDNPRKQVLNMVVDPDQPFTAAYQSGLLDGVEVIKGRASALKRTLHGGIQTADEEMRAIPYYAWANRGEAEMTVWIPVSAKAARPLPAPTIADKSVVTASRPSKALAALNDQQLPGSSDDHTVSYYHWWPLKDTTVWVEYNFDKPYSVSFSKVYWYDDGPEGGCRVPDSWKLYYRKKGEWLPVNNLIPYGTKKDQLNMVSFKQVETDALKMEVKLNKDFSTGIYEWEVN